MLTWLEINSKAIQYNLKQFRKLIGRNVLLMPVIKSNAYGHGFLNVAKICQQSKEVDRICVVNLEEALDLLTNRINKPIIILSFFDFDHYKLRLAIKNDVAFPLHNEIQAKILNKIGEQVRKKVKIHIKVDTGASRIGLLPESVIKFVKQIKKYKYLEIEGIWSHFASSEEDPIYTKIQYDAFVALCKNLASEDINAPLRHIACSASSALYPYAHFNAVRLGLSVYGLYPSVEMKKIIELKPALSWHSTVIQVKKLPVGVKIGYGGTYTTSRPTKLAVLPIGYWDGYDRRFSNNGHVLIKGCRCPIAGRICMNLTMVDATGVNVKEGDKAILIGQDKNDKITADDLAYWANTINYEIVDRINPLLPRILK